MKIRLLVLVTKGLSDDYVDQLMGDVKRTLAEAGIANVALQDSGSWFREQFQRLGDWDSWIWETVNGVDYITRQHNFDGFVVTSDQLGKANAGIVQLALRNKRAVLHYVEDRPLRKVLEVHADDPENWAEGWSIDSTALEAGHG